MIFTCQEGVHSLPEAGSSAWNVWILLGGGCGGPKSTTKFLYVSFDVELVTVRCNISSTSSFVFLVSTVKLFLGLQIQSESLITSQDFCLEVDGTGET